MSGVGAFEPMDENSIRSVGDGSAGNPARTGASGFRLRVVDRGIGSDYAGRSRDGARNVVLSYWMFYAYASNFHCPPTMVRSTGIVTSDAGGSFSGSRPNTTKSASLPASIDPLSFSSNEA
jgi:hypothetical protein